MRNDGENAQLSENEEKSSRNILSKGELESCMYRYESTFDDYLELVVQFGYVMLFAPVFPIAALCAFLNNLIEIRSDAFKLCYVYKRPFGSAVQTKSIGEWANVLYYLSIIAIATNCALMVVTGQISRIFGFTNSAHIIMTSVAVEVSAHRWRLNSFTKFSNYIIYIYLYSSNQKHSLLLMRWLIPNLIA